MAKLLTKDLAQQAVDIVKPTIQALLGSKVVEGRGNLYLVVLDPGTEKVLYEEAFSGDLPWRHPYDEIAKAKARLCQRTGMVSRNVKKDAPWHYEDDDTQYVGGVIENGLVVAASGVQDHFDEMISWMVISAIQGLCRDIIANIPEDAPPFFKFA